MNPGRKHLTVIACVIGVALASLAGNTPAQSVPIPKTPAEVPGPALGTAMTKEYVQTVGRMAYLWGWPLVNNVNRSKAFAEALPLTGVVLTKLDGDARGGAALSVRHVVGRPIKFVGVGEKLANLESFHPERMASRILGMGDVLSLVEEARRSVDIEEAEKLAKKVKSGKGFDLEDFKAQMQQMNKMGGLGALMDLVEVIDVEGRRGDGAVPLGEDERLEDVDRLRDVRHRHRIGVAIENIERQRGHQGIA